MNIPEEYKGKYFYHFTHIENLDSILKNGFLCTNKKNELNLEHTNVASENIQTRRSDMDVTCEPKGKVHDYVPFYFASTNPMALAVVNGKNIDQIDLVFLAIPIEKLNKDSVVFTDASANTIVPPKFYNNPEDLDNLNWDAINSRKWGNKTDDWKHQRMAEVLVHGSVPIDWIEYIVVWNENKKNTVNETFDANGIDRPIISEYSLKGKYFYYTKWALGRPNETLVTGPKHLKNLLALAVDGVISERAKRKDFTYLDLSSILSAIVNNFSVIDELEGIYELETINDVHNENVSDHTLNVVNNLEDNDYYNQLEDDEKEIVKFASYFHDIGKGPACKWKDGKQPLYVDHPADSLKMITRVLVEDIENISDYNIKIICKLVAYHDLLGDIIGRGRCKNELFSIIENEKELNMLIALSIADVQAIRELWCDNLKCALPDLIQEVKENLR